MSAESNFPENLLPLSEIPKLTWLPRRRGGKRPHQATIFRWVQKGVKAQDGAIVRLQAWRCGTTLCTTQKALRQFFDMLSDHDPMLAREMPRSPTARKRADSRAERDLEAAGI